MNKQAAGCLINGKRASQVVRAVAKSLADLPPGAKRRRDDSVSVGRWFLNVRHCLHDINLLYVCKQGAAASQNRNTGCSLPPDELCLPVHQDDKLFTKVVYPNCASTEIRTRLRLRSIYRGARNRLDLLSITSYDRTAGSSAPIGMQAQCTGHSAVCCRIAAWCAACACACACMGA